MDLFKTSSSDPTGRKGIGIPFRKPGVRILGYPLNLEEACVGRPGITAWCVAMEASMDPNRRRECEDIPFRKSV